MKEDKCIIKNVKKIKKEQTKMKKYKEKKPNIGIYLAKIKWPIFWYIFLLLLGAVCDVFFAVIIAKVVGFVEAREFTKAFIALWIVVGIQVFQRICWFFVNWIYYKYSNRVMADLNLDLAKQAFKLNSKTYNDHDTGTFVQRIVEDPARIVDALSNVVDTIINITTAFVIVIYIATLNLWVSLILLAIVLVGFVLEYIRVKIRRKNRSEVRKKNDMVNSLTTEIVRSEKDIKSLGLEGKLTDVSRERYVSYREARYKMDMTDMKLWTSRNWLIGIGSLLVLIFAVHMMDVNVALLSVETFIIIYSNRGYLWNLVTGIGTLANSFIDIKVSHGRMFSLFDEYEFITEHFGTETIQNPVGKIEFKNVSYTFNEYEWKEPERRAALSLRPRAYRRTRVLVSQNQIFKDLSFEIQPNTTVAFVGKSGSGKSTILNLMSKMYEADAGQVLIDGVDIKNLNKETLRSTISLVNQFPYIFDMTIKENLLLAKASATDEELWDAIRKASLEEFVLTLPKKLDTRVGESGIKLSGGQKQRLAIARALLRNSTIIIFDESTSSLDNFAQEEVKKSIDGLKGKSTIVIVAHRLSTIKNVDHIFFLENGEIVDEGTFEELFERNHDFKSMFLAENI